MDVSGTKQNSVARRVMTNEIMKNTIE